MPRIQGFNPHADTPVAGRRELLAEFLGLAVRLRAPIALALALLCWLPLHVIAVETAEVPASDGGYAAVNVDRAAQFAHVVASALQYLMPALLLTGTLVGSLQRRRRTAQGRERAGAVPVGAMLVEDFNRRLDAALSSRGYAVHLLENAVPGTADLMLARGAERRLVQRSHWQAWQVGESVIREFAAEISARQAHGGYFVTGMHSVSGSALGAGLSRWCVCRRCVCGRCTCRRCACRQCVSRCCVTRCRVTRCRVSRYRRWRQHQHQHQRRRR